MRGIGRRGTAWALLAIGMTATAARAAESAELRALLESRAEAFIAANAAGTEAAFTEFARQHLESRLSGDPTALTGYASHLRSELDEYGPIDAHRVRVLNDGRLLFVYVRRARSGSWWNYQFRVHPEDGNRLQLVFLAIAVEPTPRPETPIDAPETRAWFDRFVASLDERQPFAGVVLVARGGEELYSTVRGLADAEARIPISRSTRFNMASGSKLFTAVAILQLAEQGKLALDSTLGQILPDFPNREFAAATTIRQLLTHTAGAGDYWDEEYERAWGSITETRQMLPHVLRHLGDAPAGEFSYSNSGYVLLGLVIEKLSGSSYYDYVAQRIFGPAGMAATGYPLRSRAEPGIAKPYVPRIETGAVVPGSYEPAVLGERGSAAGGASTTADDLLRFVRALSDGKLVSRASFERMTTPQVREHDLVTAWVGLGPLIDTREGVRSWGHGGRAPGTQFELRIYPAQGIVAIAMSNYDTIANFEIASAIDDIVRAGASRPLE